MLSHAYRNKKYGLFSMWMDKYCNKLMPRVTWWLSSRRTCRSDQCAKAYAKASRVLGMIGRNIRREIMLRQYKSMVRPQVEYCTVAWSPHYVKDKQLIEKIQRQFIKMIPGFKDLSYEEGLRILRLNTLDKRRNRADLILFFSSRCIKNCLVLRRVIIPTDKPERN